MRRIVQRYRAAGEDIIRLARKDLLACTFLCVQLPASTLLHPSVLLHTSSTSLADFNAEQALAWVVMCARCTSAALCLHQRND